MTYLRIISHLFLCSMLACVGCGSSSAADVYAAIKSQDVDRLKALNVELRSAAVLGEYAKISQMPTHPLEHVIMTRWTDGTDYLVDLYGPHVLFPSGRSALTSAMFENDSKAVSLLLSAGADPRSPDRNGAVPAVLAVNLASTSLIEAMIAAGVDYEAYRKEVDELLPVVSRSPQGKDVLNLLNR